MKLAYWMYAGPAHIGTLRISIYAVVFIPLDGLPDDSNDHSLMPG